MLPEMSRWRGRINFGIMPARRYLRQGNWLNVVKETIYTRP
jgi:hypothetical protein